MCIMCIMCCSRELNDLLNMYYIKKVSNDTQIVLIDRLHKIYELRIHCKVSLVV